MSPWIIGFAVFYVYPMLSSLYFSFTHYDILATPKWVGLANYKFMFTNDPNFWLSLRNTVWLILVATPLQIIFAIGCAMVLTRPKRGLGVYRTIFFLPTMVPVAAAASNARPPVQRPCRRRCIAMPVPSSRRGAPSRRGA